MPGSPSAAGQHVYTDAIILTGRAWVVEGSLSSEAILSQLAQHTRDMEDNILLATSSMGAAENALRAARAAEALRQHGIQSVIAPRFDWSFFRICINSGLPPLTLWEAGEIRSNDRLRIDVNELIVKDLSSGTRYPIRDLSELYVNILACGGTAGYVRALQAERAGTA